MSYKNSWSQAYVRYYLYIILFFSYENKNINIFYNKSLAKKSMWKYKYVKQIKNNTEWINHVENDK